MGSANGRDGQPGWEAHSEAQLLFRQRGQTSLPEESHGNNLVNLCPKSTHTPPAAVDSSLQQALSSQMATTAAHLPRALASQPWPGSSHRDVAPWSSPPYCGDMPSLACAAHLVLPLSSARELRRCWISCFGSANTQSCLWTACGNGSYLRQRGAGVLQGGRTDFIQEEFINDP